MALIKTNARSASALDATILTGNLPAISGASLTGVGTPNFLAYVNASQTITDDSATKINFDTEVYDSDSAYNTTDKRFTVPSGAAGKYAILADVSCDGQADANLDYAYVYIYKNGSNIRQSGIDFRSNDGRRNFCHIYSVEDLAVSDYIEIFVLTFDNSGSAIVTGGTANSRFMMWRVT
jgi:hypothetical protein